MPNQDKELIGWKAISDYSNLSERHLRRLELEGKLLIKRKGIGKRAPVFITEHEIDRFLTVREKKEGEKVKKHPLHWGYRVLQAGLGVCCLALFFMRPEPEISYIKTFQMESNDHKISFFMEDQHGAKGVRFLVQEHGRSSFNTPEESFDQGMAAWFGEFLDNPGLIEVFSSERQYAVLHHWDKKPQFFPLPLTIGDGLYVSDIYYINRLKGPGYDGLGVICRTSHPELNALFIFNRKMGIIASLICPSFYRQVVSLDQEIVLTGRNHGDHLDLISFSVWDLLYLKNSKSGLEQMALETPTAEIQHQLTIHGTCAQVYKDTDSLIVMNGTQTTGIEITKDWDTKCGNLGEEYLFIYR